MEMKKEATAMVSNWSILLFKEGGQWVAMVLEHWIAWWADTPQEALLGLVESLAWQVEADRGAGQEPFSLAPRAPESYWKRYQEGALSIQLTRTPAVVSGEIRLAA